MRGPLRFELVVDEMFGIDAAEVLLHGLVRGHVFDTLGGKRPLRGALHLGLLRPALDGRVPTSHQSLPEAGHDSRSYVALLSGNVGWSVG